MRPVNSKMSIFNRIMSYMKSKPALCEPEKSEMTVLNANSLESKKSKSVVVIGAGIVGLTTAYYLQRSGSYDEIHVVDR